MSKRALTQDKNKNTLAKYFSPKPTQNDRKQQLSLNNCSKSGSLNGKRKINKSKSTKEQQLKKYKLAQNLIRKSKSLVQLLQDMQKNIEQTSNHILLKFLKNDRYKPWAEKYSPKTLNQMISNPSTLKILKWIKANTSYKRNIDIQDSFMNDNSLSMRDDELKTVLFQQKWQLKALIVLGRQGLGKQTIIKCITNTYNIRLFQCSNEKNRFNYCKQHYQSIKSHCFKNQDKKYQKQKNENKLLNYFKVTQEICNKLHLIIEMNQIYPQDKKFKFHQSVSQFVKQSEVPVIFTCSDYCIPQTNGFSQFDVIELEEFSLIQVSKYIWSILHIEFLLTDLYLNEQISQSQLQQTFLNYFNDLKFEQILTIEQISTIIQKIGLRIDKILTFFQQYIIENYSHKYFEYADIIETIDNQSKNEISFDNISQLESMYKIQKMINCNPIIIDEDKSPKQSSQSVDNDPFSTAQKQSKQQQHVENVNVVDSPQSIELQLRSLISFKRHRLIMSHLSEKISHKILSKFKNTEMQYIKLLAQKNQRKLRSNKNNKTQITAQTVLKQYFSRQQICYITNTIKL